MGDKNYMVFLILGLVLTVTILVWVLVLLFKQKKQMKLYKDDKEQFEKEKNNLIVEQAKVRKQQEDLNNAQILLQKEKEIKQDLDKKTDKEVAIDLYIKFVEMESTFIYMKNSIASIDSKIVGVKDYSNDLNNMKLELNNHIEDLKSEMTSLQKNYSDSLNSIHSDLNKSLSSIENRIESIVSNVTDKELNDLRTNVQNEVEQLKNVISIKLDGLTQETSSRLNSLSSDFGDQIKNNMPESLSSSDIENALERALRYEDVSTLDQDDVKEAFVDAIRYSYEFKDSVKEAVNEEIKSDISDLQSGISDVSSKLYWIDSKIDGISSQ